MLELIIEEAFIILIFAFALITIRINMAIDWYYLGSIILTAVGILIGVWKIVNSAFEKRDKEIQQLLKSEQEFKDHKESTSFNFTAFSKHILNSEDKLNRTLDRIDRKLDRQDEIINKQEETLARLDERTKK